MVGRGFDAKLQAALHRQAKREAIGAVNMEVWLRRASCETRELFAAREHHSSSARRTEYASAINQIVNDDGCP